LPKRVVLTLTFCNNSHRRAYFTLACGIFAPGSTVCGAGFMKRYDVRPSVRLSARCCKFAAVGPASRRYRSIAAAVACECGQCHAVSVRRPLNLLLFSFSWSGISHSYFCLGPTSHAVDGKPVECPLESYRKKIPESDITGRWHGARADTRHQSSVKLYNTSVSPAGLYV